jgi:hypothetical protein
MLDHGNPIKPKRFQFRDPEPTTLVRIQFPPVDQPAGDWAAAVLESGWDFDGARTGHDPEQLERFLHWVADTNPRRRGLDLTSRESGLLEACLTDYKFAYQAANRGARRRRR